MSVEVTIQVLGATQAELKALAPNLPSAGELGMRPCKDGLFFWKWRGFEITGLKDGLNEAGAKSENFSLDEPSRKAMIEILAAFARICPRIFSLYAAHSGELPKRESELQLTELLEVLAEGRLGNRVLYRVRDLPPKIETSPEAESTTP